MVTMPAAGVRSHVVSDSASSKVRKLTQRPRASQKTAGITQPPGEGVLHMTEFWPMRSKQLGAGTGWHS